MFKLDFLGIYFDAKLTTSRTSCPVGFEDIASTFPVLIEDYYIDTDEIPGFLLLLKNNIFTASSEHIIFIFYMWEYGCRHVNEHDVRYFCLLIYFFSTTYRDYFMESARVRDFHTRWWSIWNRTSERSERVRFLIQNQRVWNPIQIAFHAVICLFLHTKIFFIYPALIGSLK